MSDFLFIELRFSIYGMPHFLFMESYILYVWNARFSIYGMPDFLFMESQIFHLKDSIYAVSSIGHMVLGYILFRPISD